MLRHLSFCYMLRLVLISSGFAEEGELQCLASVLLVVKVILHSTRYPTYSFAISNLAFSSSLSLCLKLILSRSS